MSAAGGEGNGRGAAQTSAASAAQPSTAPATAPSIPAHPAMETIPVPPPPSPMADAHHRRHKIPVWVMPVLAALPLWAYIYQGTLSPPPAREGLETLGAELYSQVGCAGCHGAQGGGTGSFPGFTNGRIFETFPDWPTHFKWVRLGSNGWLDERGATYGAIAKPVQGGMPAFTEGQLSDAELLYIVLHERLLGGSNPNQEDMAQLEELALYMSEHESLTLAEATTELGIDVSFATSDPVVDRAHTDTAPSQAHRERRHPRLRRQRAAKRR
jgi:hypothetical protein